MADKKPKIQLPRDALSRIRIGHSFAEYDLVRNNPWLFVLTPTIASALEYEQRSKMLLRWEAGVGKTALTYIINQGCGTL